jgi:O-acetyl-ADP-ribose deacetylase (regulator of RNase III)
MTHKINNTEIEVIKDDITMLDIQAIVNPANNYLIMADLLRRTGAADRLSENPKIGNVLRKRCLYDGGHESELLYMP